MARKLKGFIIGTTNVAFVEGSTDQANFAEIERLLRFLLSKNIKPVIFGNHDWIVRDSTTQKTRRLKDALDGVWAQAEWIVPLKDGTPPKPQAAAVKYILAKFGWDAAEVVYLGNTKDDMLTAVNGGVLFLNAIWHGKNSDYGFFFESPKDVARFVDTFCLRDHLWHYAIEDDDLRYYALGPYSTLRPDFEYLSSDAKAAAKWGGGHPDFWTKYLWSTIYFSELYKEIDHVAAYPGHKSGSGNSILEEPMLAFGKCFRKAYLRDFIVRHTDAQKSSYARIKNIPIDHLNQLNNINLNAYPLRKDGAARYKQCPVTIDKTVLVIDDFCTNGYSLEAARTYIKQTGAQVVCMSWLKTINSDYVKIQKTQRFDPFRPNTFASALSIKRFPYRTHIVDPVAPEEVTTKLAAYDSWGWP